MRVMARLYDLFDVLHQGRAAEVEPAPASAARPTAAHTSAWLPLLHCAHEGAMALAGAHLHALNSAAWGAQNGSPLHRAECCAHPRVRRAQHRRALPAAPASQQVVLKNSCEQCVGMYYPAGICGDWVRHAAACGAHLQSAVICDACAE